MSKQNGESFFVNQLRFNIFQHRKWDGIAYTVLYIIIPVIITIVTLLNINDSERALAYCYVTIFISIANCIYDASGRWQKKQPVLNRKLAIIIGINALIGLYCIFEVLMILGVGNTTYRCDWILAIYLVVIIVAFIECVLCFNEDLAIGPPVDKVAKREAVNS